MPKSAEQGIERAELLLRQLRANYLDELPGRIDDLEQSVLNLKQADDFEEAFAELYRDTHSLKGSAGSYGLPIISTICHQLEDTLTSIGGQGRVNEAFLDRCIACFDLMRQAVKAAVQGETSFAAIEHAISALRAEQSGKQLKALLIEPSRVNAAIYSGVLKKLPIQLSVVESGYEALNLLLRSPYDMVITGYETPTLNGLALITALRLNRGVNRDIHAILITTADNLNIPAEARPLTILRRDAQIVDALFREVQDYQQSK